jgi:hypothetical protein
MELVGMVASFLLGLIIGDIRLKLKIRSMVNALNDTMTFLDRSIERNYKERNQNEESG